MKCSVVFLCSWVPHSGSRFSKIAVVVRVGAEASSMVCPFAAGSWGVLRAWHWAVEPLMERLSLLIQTCPFCAFSSQGLPVTPLKFSLPSPRTLRWRGRGPAAITERPQCTPALRIVQRKSGICFWGLLRPVIHCFHAKMSSFLKQHTCPRLLRLNETMEMRSCCPPGDMDWENKGALGCKKKKQPGSAWEPCGRGG